VAEDMQALVQDKMVDQEEQLDKQVLIMQVKELNHVSQEILELLDLVTIQDVELLVLLHMDTQAEVELEVQVEMHHLVLVEMVEMVKM